MRIITAQELPAFIAAKPAAILHLDAKWDVSLREQTRQKMHEAQTAFADLAGFAEMDIDDNVELARSLPVGNIPVVAYYRDGQLVAALIGAGQNIRARLRRILHDQEIGYNAGRI